MYEEVVVVPLAVEDLELIAGLEVLEGHANQSVGLIVEVGGDDAVPVVIGHVPERDQRVDRLGSALVVFLVLGGYLLETSFQFRAFLYATT